MSINERLFFLIAAKCEKKKSHFLGTSAKADLLFPDLCHPVKAWRDFTLCQTFSEKKKEKEKSRTDSHLMDTSRCCQRTRFSSRWTKMSQLGAPIAGCNLLTQSPAQHAHSVWRWELQIGRIHTSSRRLWTAMLLNRMRRLELCSNPSFVLSLKTGGVALVFADHKIQRYSVRLSECRAPQLPACPPSSAPPTASQWRGLATSAIACHTGEHSAVSGG